MREGYAEKGYAGKSFAGGLCPPPPKPLHFLASHIWHVALLTPCPCPPQSCSFPSPVSLHVLLWCVQVMARVQQEKGAGAAAGQLPEVLLHNRLMMVKVQRAMEAGGA